MQDAGSKQYRINFDVDKKLFDRMDKSIPWGVRAQVFRQLAERMVDAAEDKGAMIYGAILDGQFSIKYEPR